MLPIDVANNGLRSHYIEKIKGTKDGWKFTFGKNFKALLTCNSTANITIWCVFQEKNKSDYTLNIDRLIKAGSIQKKK